MEGETGGLGDGWVADKREVGERGAGGESVGLLVGTGERRERGKVCIGVTTCVVTMF